MGGSTHDRQLYGRAGELARLAALLSEVRSGKSGSLWIEGPAGAGKSALLRCALADLKDIVVIDVAAYEGENELSLAVLTSVAWRLRAWADRLSTSARRTLDSLLDGGRLPPDPFGLGAMLLALLSVIASERAALVVLDDAHWMDTASAKSLMFAARRLTDDRVGFLVASRSGGNTEHRPPEIELLQLLPLAPKDCRSLLADFGEWDEGAATAVQARAAGNPLLLRTIAAGLTADQRRGRFPLPDLGHGNLVALLSQMTGIADLPVQTRSALAVLAAAGSDHAVVPSAMASLGIRPSSLDAAKERGLVQQTTDGPTLAHPLLGRAVLDLTDRATAGSIHHAVATSTLSADRRSLHLAISTAEPSADVSELLAAQGARDLQQRGPVAAASTLLHSAQLTPPGRARTGRLLTAAAALVASSRPDEASFCIETVLASSPLTVSDRADATILRGHLALWAGNSDLIAGEAIEIADMLVSSDPERARSLLSVAVSCWLAVGRVRKATGISEHPAFVGHVGGIEPTDFPLYVLILKGDSQAIRFIRERSPTLVKVMPEPSALTDPALAFHWTSIVQSLLWAEQYETSVEVARRVIDAQRQALAPGLTAAIHAISSDSEWWLGRWQAAKAHADEASHLANATGQPLLGLYAKSIAMRVAAARGNRALVLAERDQALAESDRLGALAPKLYLHTAAGLLMVSLGDWAAGAEILETVESLQYETAHDSPAAIPYRADLIEALIRCGRIGSARAVLDDFSAQAERCESEWARSCALRLTAMMSSDPSADGRFEEALACWPRAGFDRARTELA